MTDNPNTSRTALVTGAAGGIGRAIIRRLAADGYRLVLTDARALDAIIEEDGLQGQVAYHATCDLESEAAVDQFLQAVLAKTQVDVLVNNAAHMGIIPFDALTPTDLHRFMRVNIEAPFQLIKGTAAGMRSRGWGRVVNIVSGSAWQPSPGLTGYITSKMGLVGLTRALAVELGADGVCVNAVTPALTRHAAIANAFPQAFWDKVRDGQAIKRYGTPEDVVGAIAFLASNDAAFMTGQTLSVDGGTLFL